MATRKPPTGLLGFLMVLGPSLVWCGEYIGSGEVIVATRTGAILGSAVIWAIVFGIFLKYWIGLCGAQYTVATGEGMIDLFSRVPGPRNWLVWVVFVGQAASGICAVGALAVAAATFLGSLFPLGEHTPILWGAIVTAFCLWVAWTNRFDTLKHVMGFCVLVIVVGVLYVTLHQLPTLRDFVIGLFGFQVPEVPAWARVGLAWLGGSSGKNSSMSLRSAMIKATHHEIGLLGIGVYLRCYDRGGVGGGQEEVWWLWRWRPSLRVSAPFP
jgi:Mn2+/Fe2+ NRAMP family transporter